MVTSTVVRPEQMATIYHNRLGRNAVHEVMGIIRYFDTAPVTKEYWQKVLSMLQRKVSR